MSIWAVKQNSFIILDQYVLYLFYNFSLLDWLALSTVYVSNLSTFLLTETHYIWYINSKRPLHNCDFSAQLSEKSLSYALSFFHQFSHTLDEIPFDSQCVDNSQYSGGVTTQCTARTQHWHHIGLSAIYSCRYLRLTSTILCVILILTLFNVEKVHGKFVSAC